MDARAQTGRSALQEQEDRRTFHVLDLLRIVAAALVMARHSDRLFFPVTMQESYLAVDLFFVMSGFVIANAYERRLISGQMTFWSFVKVRVIRLYPLYALGVGFALLWFLGNAAQAHRLDPGKTVLALLISIPMLPGGKFVTLDTPRWSLFYEVIANFLYAAFVRVISSTVLIGLIVLAAIGLCLSEATHRTLDVGFDYETAWAGVARVVFSFGVGVLLWRRRARDHGRNSLLGALALAVVAAVILALPAPEHIRPIYELGAVLFAFPAITWAATRFDVPKRWRDTFALGGVLSYAIYILHQPAALLFEAVLRRVIHGEPDKIGPWGGVAFVLFMLVLGYVADRFYDAPVRQWLKRKLVAKS